MNFILNSYFYNTTIYHDITIGTIYLIIEQKLITYL